MQGGATEDSWSEYYVPDSISLFVVLYEVLEQDHVDLATFYNHHTLDIAVIQRDHEHAYVRLQDTYLSRRVHDHSLERTLASRHAMLNLRGLEEVLGLLLQTLCQDQAHEVLELTHAQDRRLQHDFDDLSGLRPVLDHSFVLCSGIEGKHIGTIPFTLRPLDQRLRHFSRHFALLRMLQTHARLHNPKTPNPKTP